MGEEAAMPGQPVALARVSGCPPAIHPRESPAAAGSAAIIRQAQETSRFAEPTLCQIVAPRNTKTSRPCAEPVDDVTSLWKSEENLRRINEQDTVKHFDPQLDCERIVYARHFSTIS